ncbi:MAG: TlpA family protein disulfide reductase [Bdellovibrionales bacterium]|nr:TlpA family protein disulfide reductase [Bdellovibrionales bacterium]
MTKKALMIAVFGSVCLLAYFGLREKPPAPPRVTDTALSRLNGFDREKLKGRHYLLHFWAKWCEPCAVEIPHLVEFAKQVKTTKPLYVLAVSLDNTLEEAMEILPGGGKDLPPNFLLALDPEHQVAEALGSYQYPETYLVGPDGGILEKWIGAQPWKKPEVMQYFSSKIQ